MKIQYLYGVLLLAVLSCNNPVKTGSEKTDTSEIENPDSSQTGIQENDTAKENKQKVHADCPYTKIKPSTKLEVVKIEKEIEYTSQWYSEYGEKCENWNLDVKDIETILHQSEEISGSEWHYNFDILPCYYRGHVNINDKLAIFIINSGASTGLVFKDSSVHLGYKKTDYKKYFIKGRYELQ